MQTAPTLLNASIPGIGELVEQLVVELRCPSVMSAEAADSCARLLLIHVARHGRRTSKTLQPLKPDDLARLRDFVIAHLGERILVEDAALAKARLALCAATRQVLASGLALLGVSAPERM